jgi:hypothetical protein
MEKFPVSKNKLYQELSRRGLTPAQASAELGFSAGYLSNVAMVGSIPERSALYLERVYHITPEDYCPDLLDEIEKSKATESETVPNAIIQTAAETFARVFVEQYRETCRQTITDAVLQALRERNA